MIPRAHSQSIFFLNGVVQAITLPEAEDKKILFTPYTFFELFTLCL